MIAAGERAVFANNPIIGIHGPDRAGQGRLDRATTATDGRLTSTVVDTEVTPRQLANVETASRVNRVARHVEASLEPVVPGRNAVGSGNRLIRPIRHSLMIDLALLLGEQRIARGPDASWQLAIDTPYADAGVTWDEGSSPAVREETTFDITSTLDGSELSQRGEGFVTAEASFGSKLDFLSYRYDVVLDLDSRDADDTCVASRGSILSVIKFQGDQGTSTFDSTRAVSRDSTDEPWTWSGKDDGTRTAGIATDIANRLYCGFRLEP